MEDEGRIVHEMTGDNADGSTNIIPKMGTDILRNGYQILLNEIYSPKLFYERIKTFLKNYNPPAAPVIIHKEEIAAFFHSLWRLGVVGNERVEYWRLIVWTLTNYPKKFAMAITFAIYGYHFRLVNQENGI